MTCACSGLSGAERPRVDASTRVRSAGVGAFQDPTVLGGRLVPEQVPPARLTGTETDGARRGVLAGYRVLVAPDGAIQVSQDRLATTPESALAVPARLGGGYLHVVGSTVLRSDTWLSTVRPVYQSRTPIQRLFVGLDRIYLRAQHGHAALDPRTGAALELGPMPAGPQIVSYAARDGWRAAAIADLVGLVTTDDAGASWRPVDVGFHARGVALGPAGQLVASGVEGGRGVSAELRDGGQVVRLDGGKARPPKALTNVQELDEPAPIGSPEARAFGARPLLAAIEDGWPLTDGVALVARDGALARVRLLDGALLEAVPRAFPLATSRCHGVSLHRPDAQGAFGFVCGEPRGRTDLYAYDPGAGRLVLLRRFDTPRVVLSAGNGALAIRGACSAEETPDPAQQHTYCVLDHGNRFRELRVRGDVGSERVAVLADRSVAILSPPAAPAGELNTARLTLLDAKAAARTVPLAFPRMTADVARALRYGVWLDGVEERRPGVLGAWVDAGGAVIGLEIALDGAVKVGQYVRDAGAPTVSGRYGFGYTNTRRFFETSDGGMTWRSEEAPEPLVPLAKVTSRSVGPIGASAAGWLRVGWGPSAKPEAAAHPSVEPTRAPPQIAPPLVLECEPLAPVAKIPAPEREPSPKVVPVARPSTPPRPGMPRIYTSPPFGLSGVVGSGRYPNELGPFYATVPPRLREGEHPILNADAYDGLDRAPRTGLLGKIYAWGPKTPDPDPQSRFAVRWLGPFDGYPDAQSSAPSALPAPLVEAMRMGGAPTYPHYYGGYGGSYSSSWKVGVGDDGRHALLAARLAGRQGGQMLWELEAERGPLPVRRGDGEELPEVESAVRVEGKWIIAVPHAATPADPHVGTQLLVIDGGVARLLARIPRAGEGTPPVGRLARRTDGRAVGYVVDTSGQQSRGRPERWVLPIDLETGAAGAPVLLGSPDYSDAALAVCAGDEAGYVLEVPFAPNPLRIRVAGAGGLVSTLSNVLARMRLAPGRACLEAASGTVVGDGAFVARKGPAPTKRGAAVVRVGALWSQVRYPLACTAGL